MVHQTAMYYEDRLSGAGFSRVVLAGARITSRATAGRTPTISATRSSSASARKVDTIDPRGAATLTDRITREHGAARRAGAARRPAGAGTGRLSDAAHQPLDSSFLQRAQRPRRARGHRACRGRLHDFQPDADRRCWRRRHSALSSQAAAADTRARELRAHAAQTRQAIDTKQLDSISSAAREANEIINQRLFSWTDLLNRLETTLPDDVRITSLRPRVDRDGTVTVQMTVAGRSVDDIEQFMANLEKTDGVQRRVPSAGRARRGRRRAGHTRREICACPLSASSRKSDA